MMQLLDLQFVFTLAIYFLFIFTSSCDSPGGCWEFRLECCVCGWSTCGEAFSESYVELL